MMRLTALIATICLALGAATPAAAQNPFAPRAVVNDRVITNYDVSQRALFLELFNTPGDLEEEALERLIEERLQLFAAERRGIRPSEGAIADGMAEFAARADMSAEEFVQAIGEVGISEESFRQFVIAGIAWRDVVRQRFGGRVDITGAEIDRAMSMTAYRGPVRLLLSEIILPAVPEFIEQSRELAAQITQITSFEAFADAARQVSAADSAERGGRIDWIALENLPDEVRPMLLAMRPGEVTPPIPTGNAIVLFQLRDVDRSDTLPPDSVSVEYARAVIPGTGAEAQAEVARLRGGADTCRDLAGMIPPEPEERFEFVNTTLDQVPTDVALELAKLDEWEVSTNLRQGDATVLLMLCARTPGPDLRPSRQQMEERLTNERVERLARGYLEELRANAHIRFP